MLSHRTDYYAAIKKNEKGWKQPKCPSMDEWVKNVVIHIIEY